MTKQVDKQKINKSITDLQLINSTRKASSMWQLFLQPHHDDYQLDKSRQSTLKTLGYKLTTNVCNNRNGFVDITLGFQCDNEKWWQYCKN